jgi:hypothetical protein
MARAPRTTIAIDDETAKILERRGAKKDRRRGSWNLTEQLRRSLRLYEAMLSESDPRTTQGMPDDHYRFVVEFLPKPGELSSFHLANLGTYLSDLPELREAAAQASIDFQSLCQTIQRYPYAEKTHLADAALIASSPDAKGNAAKPALSARVPVPRRRDAASPKARS